jgi:hypothetical protein
LISSSNHFVVIVAKSGGPNGDHLFGPTGQAGAAGRKLSTGHGEAQVGVTASAYDRGMPEPDERGLEERVSRVEHEVVELREQQAITRTDAAAARVLAGGADRDVAEVRTHLRAHTQVLNALRETQLEHQTEMREFKEEARAGFAEMREFKEETRAGFATVHAGMARIVSLIEGVSGTPGT